LAYQWFFNATNALAGATNFSLTISNVQPANAGAYLVVATNVAGSITSAVATLTVIVLPSVTGQPQSQLAVAGDNISFSVAAVGTLPFAYQWRLNGIEIVGATNPLLSLSSVRRTNSGTYSVLVTNVAGATSSSNALLRVRVPQRVQAPVRRADGSFRLLFSDSDGGVLSTNDVPNIELHVSTNLVSTNWSIVTNGFFLTNGMIQFDDSDSTNQPRRFYRVIER
jgi:hypothetical protein